MSFFYISTLLSLFTVALSRPQIPSLIPPGPPDVANTVCGDLIVAHEQGYTQFWASDVFECLQSVPFIDSVATRFLNYFNQTLQFQSTLAYLKNPPEGYQQPPVDVLQELQAIQDKVASGAYKNQYAFEAEVQLLINRIHDAHVYLSAGILAPFAFTSPYGLVSASADGKQEPAIYLQGDVVSSRDQGWKPSPVTRINGVDVVEYLTAFAELNSEGYLEPHADWNALMEHPSRDILGDLSVLRTATFYPGNELNFTFANGSSIETYWLATYAAIDSTGPLTTAGDFYNYFVLGFLPESYDEENPKWWPDETPEDDSGDGVTGDDSVEDTSPPDYGCSNGNASEQHWCLTSHGAFPNNPDIVQDDLEITGGGVVTGYFLDDISTGVLSLPSFYATGNDTNSFFIAVDQFIGNATSLNISRIVIDLQQNSGGLQFLALSTFKRFFYGREPWTGSRIRSHELANILGRTYSEWWSSLETGDDGAEDPLYRYFASSEWVANRINAETGNNFSSWEEYYGPLSENGDAFSRTQLYNLSDQVFDSSAFQNWIPFGYGISAETDVPAQVWDPENIVILTDGLCSSACAYFLELMQQAGVKTIVAGGRPAKGPMQTASGNRGARLYSAESLDYDFTNVKDVLQNEAVAASLPSRDDRGMWINYAGFNIRDQIREGDEARIPLQFRYEAADCRIYYTLDNVYNLTRLWRDAAAATWDDPSLCVEDSTGYASRRDAPALKSPPPRTAQGPVVDFTVLGNVQTQDMAINATTDLVNLKTRASISSTSIVACPANGVCGGTTQCSQIPVTCPVSGAIRFLPACLPRCSSAGAACSGDMYCRKTAAAESKKQLPANKGGAQAKFEGVTVFNGVCTPTTVNTHNFPQLGCPTA
ncbi:uncharacterized protein EI97DRAFT_462876 [Westerdykella ornata]|uniref:CPAF-like PDZ domain-containing protein n=1 Tax=Westerdykella ornata TaxID=318751 RepID=A0A6A6J5G8_WESOR|nr:uncharacterized protein EI97DRAFT_462876 [Westerdykella ornata]KAF2271383.1 hypothetical protein EI97DRAFT_462876 [Westerdykella ornata]